MLSDEAHGHRAVHWRALSLLGRTLCEAGWDSYTELDDSMLLLKFDSFYALVNRHIDIKADACF